MATDTVKKFKWIWGWQDDVEERWLCEMSLKGYHLFSYGLAGIYAFQKGQPHDYVYRLDYQPVSKKGEGEYLQLFQDTGWEQVAEYFSWHYFRKEPKPGEANEIFTDAETKIAKYQRLLKFVMAAGVPPAVVLVTVLHKDSWFDVPVIIGLLCLAFYAYVFVKITRKIRELKAH